MRTLTVDQLTTEDAKFVELYIATGNYAKSYKLAFDPHETLDSRSAWQLAKMKLQQPAIAELIDGYHRDLKEAAKIDLTAIAQRWYDMAMADPNDLVSMRVGACRHCYGDQHRFQWREHEFIEAVEDAERQIRAGVTGVELPSIKGGFGYDATREPLPGCPQCHGEGETRMVIHDTNTISPQTALLYGGAKQTRNGVELIIADRHKALEQVVRMLGGYKDDLTKGGAAAVQMTQYVQNNFTDAKTAARAYEDMVKAGKG